MNQSALAHEWARIQAPRRGDVRAELVHEAADFLGISSDDAWQRLRGAGDRFRDEWIHTVTNPSDPAALTAFYNRSDTELFELIEWHANDPIHYRTLIVRDFASGRPGRTYLDYGSGIGNDAMVFADAGFEVTLADISDCLLTFAAWRCRRRGYTVRTVDLKRQGLPSEAFDVVVCFDVLEHIPHPLPIVRNLRQALRIGGLLAVHAPFGDDPEHPMHVVHRDVVSPRMRSLGFHPLKCAFPIFVREAQLYEKHATRTVDRAGYYIYDHLAALYRRKFRSSAA